MRARTQSQKHALNLAFKVLAAEFDHVLIVASTRSDHEQMGSDPDVYWKGGGLMANTMADFAKHRISFSRHSEKKPAEDHYRPSRD